MGFGTGYTIVFVMLLVGVIVDRAYQRLSHKWTNEPPLLPYRIPIIGHALMYGSNPIELFKSAEKHFRGCKPYSLLFFGKRVYVFTHHRDVAIVFRKAKSLPFLPLMERLSGLARGISPHGMKLLSEVDETGDSLFRSTHGFYREALKAGPELDSLTIGFLRCLQKELDKFEARHATGDTSLYQWSETMIGTAATNSMMGPALLRDNPNFLPFVSLAELGIVLFVNKVPRIFARKYFQARDHVLAAFANYFADEKNKEGSIPMVRQREIHLRAKGITTKDIAAYSYGPYAALLSNAIPTSYRLLRHIIMRKDSVARLRAEIAPTFASGNSIATLEQLQYLLTSCPLFRAFYDETLRLHTATSSHRTVVEDFSISGYTLKVGHNIICPSYIQHQLPEYFGKDPEEFDPDRFIEPVLAKGMPADPKMVRAFGGGVTLCPGRFYANNLVLSYVASVLWRFDITFTDERLASIVPRKCETTL